MIQAGRAKGPDDAPFREDGATPWVRRLPHTTGEDDDGVRRDGLWGEGRVLSFKRAKCEVGRGGGRQRTQA
jgi:hypothetical protein